jgi:hypothetical protein
VNRGDARQLLNRVRDGMYAPAWLIAQALHATGDRISRLGAPKPLQSVAQYAPPSQQPKQ